MGAPHPAAPASPVAVSVIIRAHQFVREGFRVMHGGHLVTVFSAPDYFRAQNGESNDGALLLLAPDCNGHLRIHPKRIAGRAVRVHEPSTRLPAQQKAQHATGAPPHAERFDAAAWWGELWRWLITCGEVVPVRPPARWL